MRVSRILTFMACFAFIAYLVAHLIPLQAQPSDTAKVLAAAREALGGDKALTGVKSFTATGRTKQVRGENLVPIEFEIACELPDKYVRKDEIPAQESDPTTVGFTGGELIQFPPSAAPGVPARAGAAPQTAAQLNAARDMRLVTVKQDFARLTLGMFAGSFSSFPLTFSFAGRAEAPQGRADVLDVKGPANFSARLFIDAATHLPLMVSWIAPAPPMRGGPPRSAPGPPPTAVNAPPEMRIYYADYRRVDGLQLPFRLRRAVGPDTVEETTFDGFKINAKIDPRKFEIRK